MGYRLFFLIKSYFVDILKLIDSCWSFIDTMRVSNVRVTLYEMSF